MGNFTTGLLHEEVQMILRIPQERVSKVRIELTISIHGPFLCGVQVLIHRLLLLLPPEWAHAVGIFLLRCQQFFFFRLFHSRSFCSHFIICSSLPHIRFSNRVGLAGGFDKNASVFAALSKMGFGFVELGTVTPLLQEGNKKPRLWRVGNQALINHMGFNNVGLELFRRNLVRYRRWVPDLRVFANVGKGSSTSREEALNDYVLCLQGLKDQVDGFIINISSPNTPGLRTLQNDTFLADLARSVSIDVPLFIKFSPDLDNAELKHLLHWVKDEKGMSGVVLVNTSRTLAQKLYPDREGGVSGQPLLERSLECVSLAAEVFQGKKTIIGVGGIQSGEDARKMRKVGADLIELFTGLVYRGPKLVSDIQKAINY